MASTMDMSIIRELFTAVIKSADILKMDIDFRNELIKAKEKLYPYSYWSVWSVAGMVQRLG